MNFIKTKALLFIFALFLSFLGTYSQNFNKSTDLLLANFDLKPDDDDVHAAAAFASILKHPDYEDINYYVVAGAYGTQNYAFIDIAVPDFFNTLFGSENVKWTNADDSWSASVNRVKNKVIKILNAGGKVFVQEAGQSDFTYDVIQAAIKACVSLPIIRNHVIVVQHSAWNQNNSTSSKLKWLQTNTNYQKIADGNTSGNGTPNYKSEDTKWMNLAISKNNPNEYSRKYWSMADNICDKWTIYDNKAIEKGGVDYSDCVEIWHILKLGPNADNVSAFWSRFVTNNNTTH